MEYSHTVREATGEWVAYTRREKVRPSVAVDLLEDPVHEGEFRKNGHCIQVVLGVKVRRIWMGKFIRPLVEVTFDVAGGELCPSFVKSQDNLHHYGRRRHLSCLVVEHAEDVPLVVRDDWDLDRQLVTLPHPEDTGNEDE